MSYGLLPRLLPLFAVVAVATLVGEPSPAHGASFTVDATHDSVDAAPGDGVCADATGACTLRAAVMETNALSGADEITLPAGVFVLGIAPDGALHNDATGDLDVKDDMVLAGASASETVIDGGGLHRVFATNPGSFANSVQISQVTIRNGLTVNADAGGGIANTGGDLTLIDSVITENTGATGGGAIFNRFGSLSLSRVTISANAGGSGGGIDNFEGGTAVIRQSTITGNTATHDGGGIYNQGTLTLLDTTVDGNNATTGGGIFNFGWGEPVNVHGVANIAGSTISNNSASSEGGGIVNTGPIGILRSAAQVAPTATMTITNSTVSGNHSFAPGSAVYNWSEASLAMLNVTLTANTTDVGYGTVVNGSLAHLEAKNVIFGPNASHGNCTPTSPNITSLGHNLDSDGTCALAGSGDISNADPQLGPLADNGGPTQTHALLPGSPAIDAGDDAGCPPLDQRGVARPADGTGDGIPACDIGAFELEQLGLVTIVKDAIPDTAELFAFAATRVPCPPFPCQGFTFNLSGTNEGNLHTSFTIPSRTGPIEVQESSRPAGWTLSAIACDDGSRVDLASRTAFIDVAPSEHVTCVFTNTRDAGAPIVLPPTGGAGGSPRAAPLMIAAVFLLPTLVLAVAIAHRVFTHR